MGHSQRFSAWPHSRNWRNSCSDSKRTVSPRSPFEMLMENCRQWFASHPAPLNDRARHRRVFGRFLSSVEQPLNRISANPGAVRRRRPRPASGAAPPRAG